jgi:hypothetical protein
MSRHLTPIDISNMPELVRIAEEVEATKTPRALKRDNKTVALLVPTPPRGHETLEVFDFSPLEEVKASFLAAGYSEAEVNDMIDALSELPHYASTVPPLR